MSKITYIVYHGTDCISAKKSCRLILYINGVVIIGWEMAFIFLKTTNKLNGGQKLYPRNRNYLQQLLR